MTDDQTEQIITTIYFSENNKINVEMYPNKPFDNKEEFPRVESETVKSLKRLGYKGFKHTIISNSSSPLIEFTCYNRIKINDNSTN